MQSMNTAEIEIASKLLGIQAWNNSWKQESHLGLDKCHIALYSSRTPEDLRHVTKKMCSHHLITVTFMELHFYCHLYDKYAPIQTMSSFSWNSRKGKKKENLSYKVKWLTN